jgi:hypothetical protein
LMGLEEYQDTPVLLEVQAPKVIAANRDRPDRKDTPDQQEYQDQRAISGSEDSMATQVPLDPRVSRAISDNVDLMVPQGQQDQRVHRDVKARQDQRDPLQVQPELVARKDPKAPRGHVDPRVILDQQGHKVSKGQEV